MTTANSLVCGLLVLVLGCGSDPPASIAAEATAPGYLQLHEEIFVRACGSSACHGGDVGTAGLSFSDPEVAYARLIDGVPSSGVAEVAGYKLVVPGHPEQSLLFRKLHDGKADLAAADLGAPMPLAGTETPGPKALDAVRRWVEAGAPFEGASFEAGPPGAVTLTASGRKPLTFSLTLGAGAGTRARALL